jgi:phage gp29-like protein
MGRDDRLTACLETRIKALLGSPFSVLPADDESEKAAEIAEEIGEHWFDMLSEDELAEMLKWRVMMGFAVCSLEWETTAAYWRPKVKVWNPEYCYHQQDDDTWWMLTKEAGEVQITPGDGKWMLIGRGRRPYMYGAVRSLAIPWLIRQFAVRDWARYSERHGMPLIKAMVPAAIDAPEKEEFFDDVRALSTETTIMLPTHVTSDGAGFDLELLEATDKSWQGFERLITSCNVSMSINLLGQNLTTEVQGGSYAAAKVHDRVRADYLEADAEELSTALRAQMLKPMVSFQYVEDVDELTPWPKWQTEPAEDMRAKAETYRIAGEALGKLKDAGFAVSDVESFGESLGLTLAAVGMPIVGGGDIESATPAQAAASAIELAPTDLATIVTVNEVRAGQGLTPIAVDGDLTVAEYKAKRVVVGQAEGEKEASKLSDIKLASGSSAKDARGFVEGVLYSDSVADRAAEAATKAIAPDLKTVVGIIETAEDYPEMRSRLASAYADMNPDDFAEVVEKALILSELAGRYAVLKDI